MVMNLIASERFQRFGNMAYIALELGIQQHYSWRYKWDLEIGVWVYDWWNFIIVGFYIFVLPRWGWADRHIMKSFFRNSYIVYSAVICLCKCGLKMICYCSVIPFRSWIYMIKSIQTSNYLLKRTISSLVLTCIFTFAITMILIQKYKYPTIHLFIHTTTTTIQYHIINSHPSIHHPHPSIQPDSPIPLSLTPSPLRRTDGTDKENQRQRHNKKFTSRYLLYYLIPLSTTVR